MGSVTTETDLQVTKIGFRLINIMFNKKTFQKNVFKDLTAIKLNSFQWKSINTLSYATM